MARELVFTVEQAKAVSATPISFADAGLRERDDLQEWILAHPEILGDDLLIITSEYDRFEAADGAPVHDRLDVLGLDRSGRLVVAELKRDKAASAVTMQALNYAAMMSRFSLDDVVGVFARFTGQQNPELSLAELREWAPEISDETLGPPAIILVASDFAPQVTNTAMFLFENHIDIRLIQVRLYRLSAGQLTMTASQLLPVPEAEAFMLRPRSGAVTQVAAREGRARRASIPQRLVDSGRYSDGEPMRVIVPKVGQDRPAIEIWLDEQPHRRDVTWRSDARKPLRWAYDDKTYSFSELTGVIIEAATGLPPRAQLWGPNWILDREGTPLNKVADSLDDPISMA